MRKRSKKQARECSSSGPTREKPLETNFVNSLFATDEEYARRAADPDWEPEIIDVTDDPDWPNMFQVFSGEVNLSKKKRSPR